MKNCPTCHASQWIPVADQKPHDRQDVLFVVIGDYAPGVYVGSRHSGYEAQGIWHPLEPSWSVAYDLYEGDHWREDKVTHWMPLPEPPAGAS